MKLIKFFLLTLTAATMIVGCKKEEADYLPVPKEESHFTNKTSDNYAITSATAVKKIPVGVTTVSDQDRTINFVITSPTGAQEGVHYNVVGGKSLVIKAGQAVDSLTISAVFAQYQAGRRDTLIIKLVDGSVSASKYNNEFTLVMRGPCFEGEIGNPGALNSLRGTYINSREDWGGSLYGPYVTTISAATQTSATTANITVTNIFDFGWSPITFTLDWTDINNRKITLVQQTNIAPASTAFGASQTGTIQVGPHAQIGTFSFCSQVLTLRMRIGVTGLGYDPDLYEVVMRRQ